MKNNNRQHFTVKHKRLCLKNSGFVVAMLLALTSVLLVSCKDNKTADKAESVRFAHSAETYQAQGQLHAAILEARNAIQKDPENPGGFLVLAKIYNQMGAFDVTQQLLEPIVKKMPSVSIELADAYVNNGKFRSALNILDGYEPESSDSALNIRKQMILAESYVHLGDKQGYKAVYEKLKTIPEAKNELIIAESEYLVSEGKKEEAAEKLELLSQTQNLSAKTYLMLGNFALQNNQPAKAEDFFTKAVGLLPTTDVMTIERRAVLAQLTESLILQGKTSEAYQYQKILADANPDGKLAQQKFNDAMELYRQGKFSEAEKLLEEIRTQFPQDKNSAMLLGLVQIQRGEDGRAIELFDKYIDPETASSTLIQAAVTAKFREKKMDDAIALLKKAVISQPDNADILATYGLALLDLDPKSDEGEKAIEKSLALKPEKHRLRLALAKRDFVMKNTEQGLAQLRSAYRAAPLDFVVQEAYFKQLMQLGKNEEVKQEVLEFQKNNPGSARGAFIEGWYRLVTKDYSGAQASFEKALSIKGNNEKVLAYTGLAELYQSQNQPQKAIGIWQDLITDDSTQLQAYAKWYQLVRELKRTQEANTFLVALEEKSSNWQPSAVLAQISLEEKRMPESVKYIDRALERSAKAQNVQQIAATIYHSYGLFLHSQNKDTDAKIYLLKSLNINPDNAFYLASVIQLEIALKNIPEAQKLLDQFSQTKENESSRLYLQGVIRMAENKNDEGLALYKKSWATQPMEIVAEALLQYYQKNDQKPQIEALLNDWISKIPNSYRATLLLAITAQTNNKPEDALKWYEKAVELGPNMPISLNNLAWLYYERKDPRAVELAKRAAQIAPNSAEVLDTYGWILVESGDLTQGIDVLERAASLAGNNKDIQDHLKAAKAKHK